MIERNLSNVERVVRLLVGIGFAAAVLSRPDMNGGEWVLSLVALSLILNGVFARCYLWYVLDINTCNREAQQ